MEAYGWAYYIQNDAGWVWSADWSPHEGTHQDRRQKRDNLETLAAASPQGHLCALVPYEDPEPLKAKLFTLVSDPRLAHHRFMNEDGSSWLEVWFIHDISSVNEANSILALF